MLGENIKTLRKQKGMSQEILAQQLKVVRQTISKWEKGLSVPDAEMLGQIAELFEVSVSQLLGGEIESKKDTNEVANQLSLLNEYLYIKNRKRQKALKIILCVCVTVFLVYFIVAIASHTMLKDRRVNAQTTTLICTMDGEEYTYAVTYDEQYQIIEAGGNSFIADHVQTEQYSDANILMAQIEDYFWEHGGTCERVEKEYTD